MRAGLPPPCASRPHDWMSPDDSEDPLAQAHPEARRDHFHRRPAVPGARSLRAPARDPTPRDRVAALDGPCCAGAQASLRALAPRPKLLTPCRASTARALRPPTRSGPSRPGGWTSSRSTRSRSAASSSSRDGAGRRTSRRSAAHARVSTAISATRSRARSGCAWTTAPSSSSDRATPTRSRPGTTPG